jgi:hypothetical protein
MYRNKVADKIYFQPNCQMGPATKDEALYIKLTVLKMQIKRYTIFLCIPDNFQIQPAHCKPTH